jgi:hypothetical protein
MSQPPPGLSTNTEHELLRLTFCSIVIASFFAALTVGRDLKLLLSPAGTNAATVLLGLSAAFAFAYLLSVASALKYQSPRRIDRFPLSAKVSQFFYDASINVFGVYVLFMLVVWLDAHMLHLPNTPLVWPIYAVLFSATYIVARLVWALCQRLIEWKYDYEGQREHLFGRLRDNKKGKS